ncbi:hypothetical protein GVAV_003280 [Gurleya vavrai]
MKIFFNSLKIIFKKERTNIFNFNTKKDKPNFVFQFDRINEKNCCDNTKNNLNKFLKELKANNESYKEELGRGTWFLLHSIANNYSDKPTQQERKNTLDFLNLLAEIYPCEDCRINYKNHLKDYKPNLESKSKLKLWLCNLHNKVNQSIGKDLYKCDTK